MTATQTVEAVAAAVPTDRWRTPVGMVPIALAASLLHRHRQTLARKAAAGTLDDITAVKFGSDWLFRRVDIERILGANLDDVLEPDVLDPDGA